MSDFLPLNPGKKSGFRGIFVQEEMGSKYKVVEIEGKGLGCVASEKIKKGSLILRENPQMRIPEEILKGKNGIQNIPLIIRSVLKSFNEMKKADQAEFMTLHDKYEAKCQDLSLEEKLKIEKLNVDETKFESDYKSIKLKVERIEKKSTKS